MPNQNCYVREKEWEREKKERQIKIGESHREMDGKKERQSEAQQQICIIYRACVFSISLQTDY